MKKEIQLISELVDQQAPQQDCPTVDSRFPDDHHTGWDGNVMGAKR